jgi:hypothetical protein
MEENRLVMKFDPNTIEHLGIQMYYTLPPVIAELVSNSYDADAKKVEVFLNDKAAKSIIVSDDGHGMSFHDINDKFLKIGRNRRNQTNSQKSESGNRFVIGKKGIGKLSFFGIASNIVVETIKNKKLNIFCLNWNRLLESKEDYEPEIILKDKPTEDRDGTKILLTEIKRKTGFDPNNIAYNLAKTFTVFDEFDFETQIIHNGDGDNKIEVKNDLRYQNIETEFEWDFPLKEDIGFAYEFANKIIGKVISCKNTVPSKMNGITLFSRGKLVNEPEFYNEKASSFGYAYMTGWLNIDFVDDWPKDVISTNRKSLNWEDEDTSKLRDYLSLVVKYIYKKQREEKKKKQVRLISKIANINIETWQDSLPKHEGKLAKKLIGSILSSEGIQTAKQAELVKFVKDSFQFESFKTFANDLENVIDLDTGRLLDLFKEWELIESREMYKLATGRIQTIKTFERLIIKNALEVQEIHPFFEKFPWILDPRINMFRQEAQYVKLLEENYQEKGLEPSNRRIDFLCTSVSNHRFIIEIKRLNHRITKKDIDQAKDYRNFIETRCNTDPQSPNKVIAYLVGGFISSDRLTKDEVAGQQQLDRVYIKTFNQLLTDARNYHYEFIEKHEALEKVNKIP